MDNASKNLTGQRQPWLAWVSIGVVGGISVAVGAVLMTGMAKSSFAGPNAAPAPSAARPAVDLVNGLPHTISVPETVRQSLGIRKNGIDAVAVPLA